MLCVSVRGANAAKGLTGLLLLLCSLFWYPAPALSQSRPAAVRPVTIVSSGPSGEVAAASDANEIRVVFSEPMVALGRIETPVRAPYFRIAPAVEGTFRWSGATILIFTPDPKRPLPFATRYDVTIDGRAAAVSGRTLGKPYTFSFTTPTVRLVETHWYRRGGRAGAPMVMVLRFNQPVRPSDVLAHASAGFERHDWEIPVLPATTNVRLRQIIPGGTAAFDARVAATTAVAQSTAPISVRLTNDWDKTRFPPAPNLVALETTSAVPPESWVRLVLDARLPSAAGRQAPPAAQPFTIKVEKAFFVSGFRCTAECDPDGFNPVRMRGEVKVSDFAKAVKASDLTAATPRPVARPVAPGARAEYRRDEGDALTLEDAGLPPQPPSRTFGVVIEPTLTSTDGQTLGYTWAGLVTTWHQRAFTSFGDGHGVWERSGGAVLPFYARNFRSVVQWAVPLLPGDLMPTLVKLQPEFAGRPAGPGTDRRLGGTADRIVSHGLDMSKALGASGTGLVWTAVQEGVAIPSAKPHGERRVRSSIIQVTNLGITVKDSPTNTLVFVTRLDTGAPVVGARVSVVRLDNSVLWTGDTAADGVAMAPPAPLRDAEDWSKFSFLVTAEKDGDVAYVGSDWNEGIQPWDFDVPFNLNEASPLLRGTVFSDRGVYKLGEQVTFKAILRQNAADGIRLLTAGSPLFISVRDGQDRVVDERTVTVNAWSSAEWTWTVPREATLGNYSVRVMLPADRPKPRTATAARAAGANPDAVEEVPYFKVVNGSFLVAAYRRPGFRVDVALTGDTPVAGSRLKGVVSARYLFGAPMGTRPVTWTFTRTPLTVAPPAVRERYPEDRWLFVGSKDREQREETPQLGREETQLSAAGDRTLALDTRADAGVPYTYTLEGDVEDVSRQHIANRSSIVVHPAPWYVGVRKPPYFVDQKNGLATELVTVAPNGTVAAGVPVTVTLTQVQWTSVRRAEGNGFYTWDTERKEVPAGSWTVTTADGPVPLQIAIPNGGYYVLEARANGEGGRFADTSTSFYALGNGYTAWARYDHNRIDLVPERKTYKPGDTARIMIQSPWEQATALVTTEREGIRSHRQFALTSTQQSISVPIEDGDIPNVFVSVLLVKGRSNPPPSAEPVPGGPASPANDSSDPGKPSFRLGYLELKVEDASKRLTVSVAANRTEYRPGNTAKVTLDVKDPRGRGGASEVTLWAVDYGVLSLTGYRTPDVLGSVYVEKALQVMTTDNRERIVSRRVLTPKGDTDGGGGGADPGAGTLRKDFRVLAFWIGSVATNAAGHAEVDVTLPESLTTYRIMAVAGDRSSRFGSGDSEVRINKPLTLAPAFPRFLAVGDKASFGAVITSQLAAAGSAVVSIRSLDPAVLLFNGPAEQTVRIAPGGSIEARFDAAGRAVGRARVQMTVKVANETDAFEDVIPVEVLASPETVASYGEVGEAGPTASVPFVVPAGVVPGIGGLHVELSSTAMVGLGEGARYLVEYPYGCAEQRGSRAIALVLASDLGDAFALPGVDTAATRPAAQQALKDLQTYQCASGGFGYWAGACESVSPYLTAYLLHVFKTAADLKYDVDAGMRARAYAYLEQELAQPPPANESWRPSYTAWQAFAVKVLVEAGRNQDSNLNRLYSYRDRMPVFALAYLHDAIVARGPARTGASARLADLRRRMGNAVLPEAGASHVEEIDDPYLLWLWSSNVRSTAIVLNTLVRAGADRAQVQPLVRWMMAARANGRWGNTQENGYAMEALVAYYRKYEATVPAFDAVVTLGTQEVARGQFHARSPDASTTTLPMTAILPLAQAGAAQPLTFSKQGAGTLFYTARLRYAADQLFQEGLDNGIRIQRSYAPYVETGTRPAATTYRAGDLVRVTLAFQLTKERRFVAVTDPLPAGFEPVESWFATTAATLGKAQDDQGSDTRDWTAWWQRGGFDHVERHDDRVELFATRLSEGVHEFSYIVRATTAGTFRTAPARAGEMYAPEVFGRTATSVIEVGK